MSENNTTIFELRNKYRKTSFVCLIRPVVVCQNANRSVELDEIIWIYYMRRPWSVDLSSIKRRSLAVLLLYRLKPSDSNTNIYFKYDRSQHFAT